MTVPVDRVVPYLEQLLENDDVRGNLQQSVRRARQAYGGVKGQDNAKRALGDRRVQQRLVQSAASARDAIAGVKRGGEKELQKQARRRRRRGLLLVGLVGAGAAVALNGSVRAKLVGLVGGDGRGPDSPAHDPGATGAPTA